MEKEIILENLDENIVNEATFYNQQNIPSQISKALYLFLITIKKSSLQIVYLKFTDPPSNSKVLNNFFKKFKFKSRRSFPESNGALC